jgi:hypothetical protein
MSDEGIDRLGDDRRALDEWNRAPRSPCGDRGRQRASDLIAGRERSFDVDRAVDRRPSD